MKQKVKNELRNRKSRQSSIIMGDSGGKDFLLSEQEIESIKQQKRRMLLNRHKPTSGQAFDAFMNKPIASSNQSIES